MQMMAVCFPALVALLAGASASGRAVLRAAETANLAPQELPALIRGAKGRFRPMTQRRVDQARETLQQAADALKRRLDQQGANGEAWKQYLHWNILEEQSAEGTAPDPEKLRRVLRRFVGNHDGLEMPVFTEVRSALAAYAQSLDDQAAPNLQQEFETRLDALADAVAAQLAGPSREHCEQIAENLGWLEARGQVEEAVSAVRQSLSRPNLFLRVSDDAIAAFIQKPVNETGPVSDVILDTKICGTGRTVGRLTVSLLPNDERGVAELEMVATNRSETVGYNGPVRIFQNNQARLHGRKRVIIDGAGFRALPAESTVETSSRLTGLATNLRLPLLDRVVRRMACRKYQQQKELASRIAEERQRLRLNRQLDRQLEAELERANAELAKRFFHPLERFDASPRQLKTRTRRNQLLLSLQQATVYQLGASDDPPPLVDDTDLAFQLHESAFNGFAAQALAGKTLTHSEVTGLVQELVGGPDETEKGSRADDVAITLAEVKPVTLRIDDGEVELTVRGQRFVARKRSHPPMNVTVRYRVEHAGGGARLTRSGELEIVPPRFAAEGRGRFSGREIAIRRLLRNRLGRDLDKEFVAESIRLEGELSALGRMSVVQLTADDGWLTFGCRQSPQEESTQPLSGGKPHAAQAN